MNQEIERKYLVKDMSCIALATKVKEIRQGYLSADPDRIVRVRTANDKAFITVKGKNKNGGISHFEWEKEITTTDAMALFNLCKGIVIHKKRYIIPYGELQVEVDVFEGKHKGLCFAEIEFPSENYKFTIPPYLGDDVTTDMRYQNSFLSEHEYKP